MFGFNKNKKKTLRTLNQPTDLTVGDILLLNERQSLPEILRGQQFEVTAVGTYQYSSGLKKEVTLRAIDNTIYYLSMDDNDGDPRLCFSIKINRSEVGNLFDLDQFATIFDDLAYATLDIQTTPSALQDWISGNQYQQTLNAGQAYFFDEDLLAKEDALSLAQDDESEELRYHQCESRDNDNFSLLVEVWGSGETDVFLEVSTPLDVVAEMWPHAKD